jgi:hypothetical protein
VRASSLSYAPSLVLTLIRRRAFAPS